MSIIFSRGDGYQAEVKLDGQHIELLVHINETGCFAVLFDKVLKRQIGKEQVIDFEDGKQYAVSMGSSYLRRFTRQKFPAIEWKPTSYLRDKLEMLGG